jgi:ribA/ribD-fused uncharacterized protein
MSIPYNINWLTAKFDSGEPIKYLFFWGHTQSGKEIDKSCFSQWYEAPFTVNSLTYKTAEHWMMAQKALLFGDDNSLQKIIAAKTPGEAKALGRTVEGFNDDEWNLHRYEIVKQGNLYKFKQHKALVDYLLKTGNKVIVEASPVDPVWGIGLSQDSAHANNPHSWRGLNLLGFALMEVRDILKQPATT